MPQTIITNTNTCISSPEEMPMIPTKGERVFNYKKKIIHDTQGRPHEVSFNVFNHGKNTVIEKVCGEQLLSRMIFNEEEIQKSKGFKIKDLNEMIDIILFWVKEEGKLQKKEVEELLEIVRKENKRMEDIIESTRSLNEFLRKRAEDYAKHPILYPIMEGVKEAGKEIVSMGMLAFRLLQFAAFFFCTSSAVPMSRNPLYPNFYPKANPFANAPGGDLSKKLGKKTIPFPTPNYFINKNPHLNTLLRLDRKRII